MTAALALFLAGVLLIALGRRHRFEPAAPHLTGAGYVCLLLGLLLFASRPAAADPAPAEGERYIVLTLNAAQQIVAKLEAQAAEIERLREELRRPKACI